MSECIAVSKRLASQANVRCIVDRGIEELDGVHGCEYNANQKLQILEELVGSLGNKAPFMPLKMTVLVPPGLLEKITSAACEYDGHWRDHLDAGDLEGLELALRRLRRLCEAARRCKVSLLLDAEQTAKQPAVHLVARELQKEFNTGGFPVVYDTLQMYLKSSLARLEEALVAAQSGGYTYAVKLVRGAYLEQERASGLLYERKEETDWAYDAAVEKLLSEVALAVLPDLQGSKTAMGQDNTAASLLLATHNRASLKRAVAFMAERGLARNHPNVHFAQILGMVDNLTNALGLAGYNATKLVVYGEMQEVLPWLLRRVEENRDAMGAQAGELPTLRRELLRRLMSGGAAKSIRYA